MTDPKATGRLDDWLYHSGLWVSLGLFFLVLIFANRVDDLLVGLGPAELLTNFAVPFALCWPLAAALGLLSLAFERLAAGTLMNSLYWFVFLTINWWSFKGGLSRYLATVHPEQRTVWAWVSLAVVILACVLLAFKRPGRWGFFLEHCKKWLGGLLVLNLLLLGPILVPGEDISPPVPAEAPNIIWLTFDALTAKRVGTYGFHRDTMPNLTKLAQESYLFENFRTSFTSTQLSLIGLSGGLPLLNERKVESTTKTLFDVLRTQGYPHTAFFSYRSPRIILSNETVLDSRITRSGVNTFPYKLTNRLLAHRHLLWLSGILSEDFEYFWPYTGDYSDSIFWTSNHYPGAPSLQSALEFLKEHPRGAFVWVHLWEPHYPYCPPEELVEHFGPAPDTPAEFIDRPYRPTSEPWVRAMANRYDANVLEGDMMMGKFFDELKKHGLYDTSHILVGSDHGESFENGYIGHSGPAVEEGITHIPILLRPPGGVKPTRIATPANHMDIAPTFLELLGLPPFPEFTGESLVPYLKEPERVSDRVKFSISASAFFGRGGEIALYWKRYKLVYSTRDPDLLLLFDLEADPELKTNLAASRPDLVREIQAKAGLL